LLPNQNQYQILELNIHFFGNLTIFPLKISDQIFPFHIYFHICQKFQTKKKKRIVMTRVFECFQSHCHIWKKLHHFLCMMMGAITILGKNSFKFSFVGYGLMTKPLGLGYTFEEVAKKKKKKKQNVKR
jgi:hypothetical protein